MKAFLPKDEDYAVWILLGQTREAMYKARQRELKRYNITPRQAAILFTIETLNNDGTPAEISRRLLREPHTVSELLSRMEQRGLVARVKDLDRKNMVRIVMTEKGREAYSQSTKRDSIHRIMSSLSKRGHQELTSYLKTLRDTALQEKGMDGEPHSPA